ncbi:MAG TPA: ElyC/SanA/YdcF family protein [Candidatus Udaeobacter sp.]|nr:ElyC/SanA/YdcF family protein [Candidatus Udaeobacter sp.]
MSDTLKDLPTPKTFGTAPLAQVTTSRSLWGLFDRKERWSLSWRGRLILALALLLVSALVLNGVYPFLAVTHRVNANILVVEGWINEYAIRAAVKEFQSKHYQRVFTTGGPVEGTGGYINDFMTSASVGADLLEKAGVPEQSLQMVPSRVMDRDRTYGSAVALRNWFRDHNMVVSGIDVVTEDVHARRTRLLFQKALGKDVQVGIIAVANVDYPANRWWHYSQGVKNVVSEFAAYLYARFLFFPSEPVHSGKVARLSPVHD